MQIRLDVLTTIIWGCYILHSQEQLNVLHAETENCLLLIVMVINMEDVSILQLPFAVLEHSFKKFQMLINISVLLQQNVQALTIKMALIIIYIGI